MAAVNGARVRFAGPREVDGSDGGLYNPGAWYDHDGELWTLLRREPVARCGDEVRSPILTHWPFGFRALRDVPFVGRLVDRQEDCRPFLYRGETLVVHTEVPNGVLSSSVRSAGIQPRMSRLVWEHDEVDDTCCLRAADQLALPRLLDPVEKNWVLLTRHDDLYLVYSLDPLVIYRRLVPGQWHLAVYQETDWTRRTGKPPRNSTHLLPFDGGWLGWWHLIFDGSYVTGAYWLDEKLTLQARTGILFDGQDVREGYKPGVLYLSSYVREDADHLRLFWGEADTWSSSQVVEVQWVRDRLTGGPHA